MNVPFGKNPAFTSPSCVTVCVCNFRDDDWWITGGSVVQDQVIISYLQWFSGDADWWLFGSDCCTGAPPPLPASATPRLRLYCHALWFSSYSTEHRWNSRAFKHGERDVIHGVCSIEAAVAELLSSPTNSANTEDKDCPFFPFQLTIQYLLVSEILRAANAFGVVLWKDRWWQTKRPKWVQGGTRQRKKGGDTNTGREEQWERGKGDRGEEKKKNRHKAVNKPTLDTWMMWQTEAVARSVK